MRKKQQGGGVKTESKPFEELFEELLEEYC